MRHIEHENFLEENWFYEAITETYVPLLRMMDTLRRDSVPFRLTMTVSPTLVTMLQDPLLLRRYEDRLRSLIRIAQGAWRRSSGPMREALRFQVDELEDVRKRFVRIYDCDLVSALAHQSRDGSLELITCAATHGFLPLLRTERNAVRGQIMVGAREHRRVFGKDAKGIWLPECGYFPGVEEYLAEAGISFSILEAHGLLHAHPAPSGRTYAPILSPGGIAFFARDTESSEQVWSSEGGYPGDPAYREFYRDLGYELPRTELTSVMPEGEPRRQIGVKVHRITGGVNLASKAPYVRAAALLRTKEHARHFVECREQQARRAVLELPLIHPPVVTSPYDAELFGHWWFEGPQFLEEVFRQLAKSQVAAITPSEYLRLFDECEVVSPPLSTWGAQGYAEVWLNPSNDWVYPHLDEAARTMARLVSATRETNGQVLRALRQAGRELLLAQSSDWPFIMKTGTHLGYARERVTSHLTAFGRLANDIATERIDETYLRSLEKRHPIFPALDPQWFGARLHAG